MLRFESEGVDLMSFKFDVMFTSCRLRRVSHSPAGPLLQPSRLADGGANADCEMARTSMGLSADGQKLWVEKER